MGLHGESRFGESKFGESKEISGSTEDLTKTGNHHVTVKVPINMVLDLPFVMPKAQSRSRKKLGSPCIHRAD